MKKYLSLIILIFLASLISAGGSYNFDLTCSALASGYCPSATFNTITTIVQTTLNVTDTVNAYGFSINNTDIYSIFSPISEPLSLHLNKNNWFNDDWILYDTGTKTFSFNESQLATVYFNATKNYTQRGTSTSKIQDLRAYDGNPFNVTESSGAIGINFKVNFTGVTDFNQLIFRYKSTAGESHTIRAQIWEYDDEDWENYASLAMVEDYNVKEIGVYDADEHIHNGVVQVRFYQTDNGNTNHVHYFDWITIAKGFATPSGAEIDPLSWHKDENIVTAYNISASNVYAGNIVYSNGTGLNDTIINRTIERIINVSPRINQSIRDIMNNGTYALNSSLSNFVPYTGATADVDLGLNDIKVSIGTFYYITDGFGGNLYPPAYLTNTWWSPEGFEGGTITDGTCVMTGGVLSGCTNANINNVQSKILNASVRADMNITRYRDIDDTKSGYACIYRENGRLNMISDCSK